MKNCVLIILVTLAFYSAPLTAQKNKYVIHKSDETISLNLNESSYLVSPLIVFPSLDFEIEKNIIDIRIDHTEENPKILVFSKPQSKKTKGKIITYYDLINNKPIWSVRGYMKQVSFTKKNIIFFNKRATICVDKENGKMIWSKFVDLQSVHDSLNVLKCSLDSITDVLIETSTGKQVASFSPLDIRVTEDFVAGKTIFHLNQNSLRAINNKEGVLWEVKLKTTKADMNSIVASSIIVAASFVLINSFPTHQGTYTYNYIPNYTSVRYNHFSSADMQTGMQMVDNIIYGLHSNIYRPNEKTLWIADKKNLLSINISDGSINWKKELPQKKNGNMRIKEFNDKILLICSGKGLSSSGYVQNGKPYLYEMSMQKAEEISYHTLNANPIDEYIITENMFEFSTSYSYQKFTFSDSQINGFDYANNEDLKSKYGKMLDVVDDNKQDLYLTKGHDYTKFSDYFDFEKQAIIICQKGVIILNREDLSFKRFIPITFVAIKKGELENKIFIQKFRIDDYGDVSKEDRLTIIDNASGKKLGVDENYFVSKYRRLSNGMIVPTKQKTKTFQIINPKNYRTKAD